MSQNPLSSFWRSPLGIDKKCTINSASMCMNKCIMWVYFQDLVFTDTAVVCADQKTTCEQSLPHYSRPTCIMLSEKRGSKNIFDEIQDGTMFLPVNTRMIARTSLVTLFLDWSPSLWKWTCASEQFEEDICEIKWGQRSNLSQCYISEVTKPRDLLFTVREKGG